MLDINDKMDPHWAWSAYQPSEKNPWNLKKAGHLLRRASFGANWTELQNAIEQGPAKTVAGLLQGGPGLPEFEKETTGMAQTIAAGGNGNEIQLRAWWLYRMLRTPHPLKEKLTLCWHNHFATSNAKVRNLPYMLGQNQLMYRHALGCFHDVLHEMSKDPAMMIWLDTNQSKLGMPNENYARELMELFSLGRGHYTEQDIREAARAFTGWQLKKNQFHFDAAQHDDKSKNVIGQTGNWNGEDIVRICLDQKACPYFITMKLFRFLVSESIEPTDELLEPLATQFRQTGFNIGAVVATILRSNLFYSDMAYRSRVKSPTDFAVGIVHALEGSVGTVGMAAALENLGQKLFAPPSVKGWDGGAAWVNSTTLLLRQNLALALTSTEDQRFGRRCDPAELIKKYNKRTDEEVVDFFVGLFFQGDLPADSRAGLLQYMDKSRKTPYPVYWIEKDVEEHRLRAVCHLALTQPEFQLD
jgi:hypothetical protein